MMRVVRSLLAILIAAAVPFAAPTATASGTRAVRVVDTAFRPRALTVTRGTTVVWRWRGEQAHNVTVRRGPVKFASATKVTGTFRRRMWRRGTYRIVCTIHMPDQRMKLTVTY